MDNAQVWRAFFAQWPPGLPTRGVIVTSFDEQIQFASFLTTDSLLLVERQTPDTLGARRVVVPYGNVLAVKIVDPVTTQIFTAAGFKEADSQQKRVSN